MDRVDAGQEEVQLFVEGLGTVAAILPSLGSPARAILTLASSFMTGNFTLLVVPFSAAATTMMLAQLAHQVLSPKGVEALSAVVPDGPTEMLDILAESPRVQALVFFGRREAGKEASAQAAAIGKAVVTAWDSADVAIIWDDVDAEGAAKEIVSSRFSDSGRVPSSIGRVLVHSDVKGKVVSALEGEIHSLRVGLPSDPTTDVGPVGSLVALERLCEAVKEASDLGARLVHGGERINWRSEADPLGMYFQPTLLEGCTVGMGIMNEDVLGPVLPISTVESESKARALACTPKSPGRVWIWATSRADRDMLVDGLRAPGVVFFGKQPGGRVGAVDLNDSWGALELAERLSYKTWRGPVGQ
jgi:acyl-CoA reductase-like NAD-dependent aldehyde dehydrogenase